MTDALRTVRQLLPHWIVMLVLMLGLLLGAEAAVGPLPFWGSLALVFAVAFGYPVAARRLGVAPPVWRRD